MKDIKINAIDYIASDKNQEQSNKALKKACKEFESLFTYELLKSMRRTVDKCDLFHGGQGEEIYESMLDQELSKNISGHGSNSISGMLYQQLNRSDLSETDLMSGIDPDNYLERSLPQWPVKASISSKFGWRKDPFTGESRFHSGIDIAAEEGTKINASLSGKVIISGKREGYGNLVALDHGNGFVTFYAHNRENLVKPGDWVKKGAPIATVGSSGRSTGPHLHFEVKRDGKGLDPMKFLGT